MLSPKYSRLLAIKVQYAKRNKDIDMINKIQNIKYDSQVSSDILNYKIKHK